MARPKGSKQKKPLGTWKKANTTLSPEAVVYLADKKKQGIKLNKIFNQAILEFKEREKNGK